MALNEEMAAGKKETIHIRDDGGRQWKFFQELQV